MFVLRGPCKNRAETDQSDSYDVHVLTCTLTERVQGLLNNRDQSQSTTRSQHLSIKPTYSFCLLSFPTINNRALSCTKAIVCLSQGLNHLEALVLCRNSTVATFISVTCVEYADCPQRPLITLKVKTLCDIT